MSAPYRSDQRLLRRSLYVSGGVHVAVLLALIISVPPVPPPEEPPTVVEMQFEGAESGGASAKADKPDTSPAPAPAPEEKQAPPSPEPPKPVPEEEAPPPPPPPQPVPPPSVPQPEKLPDTPLPPKAQEPSPEAVKTPPSPPAPPKPMQKVVPPSPITQPAEELPDAVIPSHITQPNKAKKTQQDSHSLLETLEAFRAEQPQTHPPKARANPTQGGSPHGGGTPDGDITRSMSSGEQKAIGSAVRRCYTEDTAARNYATFVAHLVVTVDADGEARIVTFAPETQARMNADASYRALAERARSAVLSPTCSKLPIPKKLLGQTRQLKFVFRP
ncbi:energy transducer TonB [Acetobacter thailandicus]|uniref:energy transducer TonB n=1 Tax=Acetobacter thailandicus TaxID=1502842 RepID=UPI001BA8C858|nr:energy transducer TonB [Acetobacter thailandicus]MBS0986146.1 energy transducer TonB [Acetobacter thailandicus]